jgi:hypothetical protein
MIDKKIIKEIVNRVIDYGYDDGEHELHLSFGGDWECVHIQGEMDAVNYTSDALEMPIPEYEDEPFVEDKKAAFTLDLMQIISEWEQYLSRSSQREGAKKTHAILKKKDPDHFKKLAQKRWKKKN